MANQDRIDPRLFSQFVPLNALGMDSAQVLARKATLLHGRRGQSIALGGPERRALFLLAGELELIDMRGIASERLAAGAPDAAHRLGQQASQVRAVRGLGEFQLLAIDAELLDALLSWDQEHALVVGEIGESDSSGDAPPGSPDDWMHHLLQMPAFRRIPPTQLQALLLRLQPLEVAAGDVMLRQGEVGEHFYLVLSGRAAVSQERGQACEQVAELAAGSGFGEEALITSQPRNATVTMLSDGRLLRLAKDDFRRLLRDPLERRIDFATAQRRVAAGQARWLDVRLPSEQATGSLPGTLKLPLAELRTQLGQLDRGLQWIVCCDTGRRSAIGGFVLVQRGFDAEVLDGGLPAT